LEKENICPIKIEEYFNKIVEILIEDLKSFSNNNKTPHDNNLALNISKNSDKNCIEKMIKNYIYSITVTKTKDFVGELNLNSDEINIYYEDFKKIANFINEFDNDDNFYKNNDVYKENYSILINNQKAFKKKPIFLLKKVKREKSIKKKKSLFNNNFGNVKFNENKDPSG
jgi:hypothetical protein